MDLLTHLRADSLINNLTPKKYKCERCKTWFTKYKEDKISKQISERWCLSCVQICGASDFDHLPFKDIFEELINGSTSQE